MHGPDEDELAGGNASASVVRAGATVRKPWLAATDRTIAYMRSLRAQGIDVPEHLGRDEQGRQVLEYVPGQLAMYAESDVAEPLLSYPAAQFVVIGSSDPYFRQDVLDALPGERLVVAGDHILRVPGDAAAMVASHDLFARSFDAWLTTIQP